MTSARARFLSIGHDEQKPSALNSDRQGEETEHVSHRIQAAQSVQTAKHIIVASHELIRKCSKHWIVVMLDLV